MLEKQGIELETRSFFSAFCYFILRYILVPLRIADPVKLHFAPEPALVPVVDRQTGKEDGKRSLKELVEGEDSNLYGRKAFFLPSFFIPG